MIRSRLNVSRRELRAVLIIWVVVLVISAIAIVVLRASALRIINHIEYVDANRYQRIAALFAEAQKHAGKALAKAAKLNQKQNVQVLLSANDGNYKSAVELYKRALSLDVEEPFTPSHQIHYDILAQLSDAVGNTTEQYKQQAKASLAANDFENAEVNASRIPAVAPHNEDRMELLSELFLKRHAWERAQAAIQEYERVSKDKAKMHNLYARLFHERDDAGHNPKKAIEHYQAAIDAGSKDINVYKRTATLLASTKQYDKAAGVLEKGMPFGNDEGNYLDRYGHILLELKRNKEAVRVFEQARKLSPFSPSIHWGLARAYNRLGRTRESNDSMQRAMVLDPARRRVALEP